MLFKESIKRFTPPKGWSWASIGDVAKLSFSSVDKKSVEGENAVRLCNYMDVFYNRRIREGMPFMASTASDSDIKKFTLNKGDVVLTKDSETPEEIAFAAVIDEQIENLVCGYHLAVLRPDKAKVTGEYLMSAINFYPNHHQFVRLANGATRFGLGIDSLNNALLPLPSLAEQRKIAEILRTWDKAIETTEAEIRAKQERKRVLMKGLFSQKDGRQVCDSRHITEIADLSKERPQGAEIVCVDLEHISPETCQLIGSHPVRGDEVSKYRFKNGDVLFAKLRPYLKKAWLSDREGICSSEFWVFRAKTDKGDSGFIRQFVLSEPFLEACAASSGSKMPRADWSHVEKVKFYLPPLSEQSAIAAILKAADAEIETSNKLIMLLRNQKRGLMQKLLTGEVRVAA